MPQLCKLEHGREVERRHGLYSNNLLSKRTSIFLVSSVSGLEEQMNGNILFPSEMETSMNQLQGNTFLFKDSLNVVSKDCIKQNITYFQ
jgi:hypothetical protein